MDNFYDDDDQAGGTFSFENIGKLEALKTSSALLDIEELLHANYAPAAELSEVATNPIEDESPFEQYRRLESNGYDAHSESVDKKEILSWQSAFPYIIIKGQGIKIGGQPGTNEAGQNFYTMGVRRADEFSSVESNSASVMDLTIEGKRCNIQKFEIVNFADDEEHGSLEELIAVHVCPITDEPSVASESSDPDHLSPHSSRREEIVSLLLDAVWPEVVDVLKPLVLRVVQVSRSEGIKYDAIKKNASGDYGCYGDDDRMSVEDGYASW